MGRYLTATTVSATNTTKETFQNTDNPYGFQSAPAKIITPDTTNTKMHVSAAAVVPGIGSVIYDKSITTDIVHYTVNYVHDYYNDYAVLVCTKYVTSTGASTAGTWMLYRISTQLVQEITDTSVMGAVINGDGYLYIFNRTYTNGVASGGWVQTEKARLIVRPLTNLSTTTATVIESSATVVNWSVNPTGSGGANYSRIFISRKTDNTGVLVTYQSTNYGTGSGGTAAGGSSCSITKWTMAGATTASSTVLSESTYTYSSGSGTYANMDSAIGSNGILIRIQIYNVSGGNFSYNTMYGYAISEETGVVGSWSTSGYWGPQLGYLTSVAIVNHNIKVGAVILTNSNGLWVGMNNGTSVPNVSAGSTSNATNVVIYGNNNAKVITDDFRVFVVDFTSATTPTITFVKQLATVAGGVAMWASYGLTHKWAILGTSKTTGKVYYLATKGINVDAVDPAIYSGDEYSSGAFPSSENNKSPCSVKGYPISYDSGTYSYYGFQNWTGSGGYVTGVAQTSYMTYPGYSSDLSTSFECNGLTWTAITAGKYYIPWVSTAEGTAFTGVGVGSFRLQQFNAAYYNSATKPPIVFVGTTGYADFSRIRITFTIPSYTNTSTVPQIIQLKIHGHTVIRSLKITNTPAQNVFISGSNYQYLNVYLAASTNMISEDVVMEGEIFYNTQLGSNSCAIIDATTGLPITTTGGAPLSISNKSFTTKVRSLSEFYS